MNFELNRLLFIHGQYVKIVHLPKIAAGRCKNTKLTGNASRLAIELISNNNDIGIELYGKAMIKAN